MSPRVYALQEFLRAFLYAAGGTFVGGAILLRLAFRHDVDRGES